MKSFWKIVSLILTGLIAGLILSDKLNMGAEAIYKGNFRFKLKGKGNTQNADVRLETPERSPKAQRILDRLEKQKAKAQKKLTKQHRNSGKL